MEVILFFCELIQEKDGTLNTKFPEEMMPATESAMQLKPIFDETSKTETDGYVINSLDGVGTIHFENLPNNCRITMEIQPMSSCENYGLYFMWFNDASDAYRLSFSSDDKTVSLCNSSISAVDELNKTIKLDVILRMILLMYALITGDVL